MPGSEERPLYAAVRVVKVSATDVSSNEWAVTVDEGWRSTIVASGMYEWSAKWLVDTLQGKPYAKGYRP